MPGNSDERGTIETPNPAQTAARTLTLLDPVKPILPRRFSRVIDCSACCRSTLGSRSSGSSSIRSRVCSNRAPHPLFLEQHVAHVACLQIFHACSLYSTTIASRARLNSLLVHAYALTNTTETSTRT